jgi:hypothetical protein
MPGRHILVERLDSSRTGELTILLVHIVCSRARIVANPDTKVLDLQWPLLRDLAKGYQGNMSVAGSFIRE